MSLVPVKTPLVVKKMFPNYIWDLATNEKTIYLTFDDGPTPEITDWVLDVLNQFNAKATFFCIGNNIEKHPEIFQNIVTQGHVIGNHTHNHIKGWKTRTKDYIENVSKAQNEIDNQVNSLNNSETETSITGIKKYPIKNLFRPPYGRIKPKQANKLMQLGYQIIMWDVLSFDWDHDVAKEKCFENVIENTVNGSIIVFHDSLKASENMRYVLPKTLDYYSKQGFTFKSL
tara:strand:- start:6320 stop:7006 length:687 start_codon:yes stop_codon:yes gene_type:complete